MKDSLRIGSVIKPHGVKGEVKVYPTTDDVHRFETVKTVFLERKGRPAENEPRLVTSVKYFKGQVIVKLSGIDSMEDAESIRGADLLILRSQSTPLKEGQYYLSDLIGLNGITEDGSPVGTLKEILETGANDVFVFRNGEGRELLLPNIPDCILNVSMEEGFMTVSILPGLEYT
ncbi:MAG: 16S rRNA processing protein RimM [Lachnospiraceae bacterium]|nr:16S rRNA processing protein RimM [Lachnospiraceae bacterium]